MPATCSDLDEGVNRTCCHRQVQVRGEELGDFRIRSPFSAQFADHLQMLLQFRPGRFFWYLIQQCAELLIHVVSLSLFLSLFEFHPAVAGQFLRLRSNLESYYNELE